MGLLGKKIEPLTYNRGLLAQGEKARNKPAFQMKENTPQGLLDAASLATSPVPILGDLIGLGADANRFITDPSSRTPGNYGLAALGLLPFVPSGVGAVKKMTQYEKAHEIAQKNAAKPISEGGLGLPPNNTAMDRARAMGFDRDLFHGSSNDIKQVDLQRLGSNTGNGGAHGPGFYMSELPWHSELYAGGAWGKSDGANLMPLKVRFENPQIWDGTKGKIYGGDTTHPLEARWWENGKDGAIIYRPGIKGREAEIIEAVSNRPENIRSRFAAFDPKKKNSANIMATAAPVGLAGILGLSMYDARND